MDANKLNKLKSESKANFENKLKTDPDKNIRQKIQVCKKCQYSQSFVGMMISKSNCLKCNIELISGNTNTDVYCIRCAKMINKCASCGNEMD